MKPNNPEEVIKNCMTDPEKLNEYYAMVTIGDGVYFGKINHIAPKYNGNRIVALEKISGKLEPDLQRKVIEDYMGISCLTADPNLELEDEVDVLRKEGNYLTILEPDQSTYVKAVCQVEPGFIGGLVGKIYHKIDSPAAVQ